MLGYAFMGKAHSSAFPKIRHVAWPPPLVPQARGFAGRTRTRSRTRPTATATRRWTTDWRDLVADPAIGLFDNGGPNSLHAEPTIAAARSRQARPLREAARPRRRRGYEIWHSVAATGVKHLCAFNYRFVPAVRLAREMIEAGELGEIRHFRGRYLQDWGDDPSLDTWRFTPRTPAPARSATSRPTSSTSPASSSARSSASPASRRRSCPAARSTTRSRPRRVRDRLRRHDRGDAVRARTAKRVPVGDQRHEGIARVRHGAAERAPGLPCRRRPCARLKTVLVSEPTIPSGELLVAARPHHRLGRHLRARARTTCSLRSPTTATSRPTAPTSRTATAPPRSATRSSAQGENGAPETITYPGRL